MRCFSTLVAAAGFASFSLLVLALVLPHTAHAAGHSSGHSSGQSAIHSGMHEPSGITNQDLLNAQYDQAVEAVRDKNYRVAVAIFEEQAALSQHNAQYNLALLLKKGLGKPQNYGHAFKWAWLARLGGVKKAEHLIDELTAIIPEENHEEMRMLVAENLTNRIDAGDHRAITQYARYLTTALPEADYATAYKWYSVAAALKLPGGINGREAVYEELDPANIMTLQNEALQLYEKVTSQN